MVDFIPHVARESEAFVAACLGSGPDAPVPTCPGWTVTDLMGHLGTVQRFHGGHMRRGVTEPPPGPRPTPPAEGLVEWVRQGTAILLDTLEALPADAPAWTFEPGNPTMAFWRRRMAHEAAIHRWDAEHAAQRAADADTASGAVVDDVGRGFPQDLAVDGIAEYLTVFLPRSRTRTQSAPEGTVVLAPADGPSVGTTHGDPAAGQATVRGTAEELYLAVWGRIPLSRLHVDGDAGLAASIINV